MALLEIKMPVMLKKRYAVGIDLGTTHSLIACDLDGTPTVLLDEAGEALLPSVVRYCPQGAPVVGTQAKAQFVVDPQNTLVSTKRLMGKSAQEALSAGQFFSAYELVDQQANVVRIKTCAGEVTPMQVSGEILNKLMTRVAQIDKDIVEAVITVPAYFDEAQRQATKEAAQIAGIKVLRLLNEPTAAAVAYGLDQAASGICLVFDLGGGTFDVSVLRLSGGVFEVLATGGDTALGGDDIDGLVATWIMSQQAAGDCLDPAEIMIKAREAKEQLSTTQHVSLNLAHGWQGTLTRAHLEDLTAPLVEKMRHICKRVLLDASLSSSEIDHIVLVGGATRMPYIRAQVADLFHKAPLDSIDPDKIVALGAAIQASQLVGNRRDNQVLLLDVIPLSLGIEMMGGGVEQLLLRNSPIPATASTFFTTYQDGQTGLSLHVVQGEYGVAADCRSLAKFNLSGFPPMAASEAKVEVTFRVDSDGLLTVSAKELNTGISSQVEVKPTYGLTQEQVNALVEASISQTNAQIKANNHRRTPASETL